MLAATTLRLEESLTGAALTMFDKLLGSMVRRAEIRTRDRAIRTVSETSLGLRLTIAHSNGTPRPSTPPCRAAGASTRQTNAASVAVKFASETFLSVIVLAESAVITKSVPT